MTDTDWGSADSTLDMVGLNELSIRKTQVHVHYKYWYILAKYQHFEFSTPFLEKNTKAIVHGFVKI